MQLAPDQLIGVQIPVTPHKPFSFVTRKKSVYGKESVKTKKLYQKEKKNVYGKERVMQNKKTGTE